MAATNGVDQSFIKYNCNQIDPSGKLFKKTNVKVHTARYIFCGLIALNIKDYNEKVEAKHNNPLKDMVHNIKEIVKESKVRTYLISYILGKEVTHSQIWVFTPLLVMVGVTIEIVSLGWVLNQIMQIIGSKISKKTIKLKTSNKFAIPISIEMVWMAIIVFYTNIVTVWLFALNGFVHGLVEGSLITVLQESTKDEVQTSVMSVASTGARLLYIPLVFIINYLGNIRLQLALVGVIVLFLPMSLVSYISLKKLERKSLLPDAICKEKELIKNGKVE